MTNVETKSKNCLWLFAPTTNRVKVGVPLFKELHLPQFQTHGQWL